MIDAEYVKRLATQTTLDLWPGWVHEGRSLENLVSFAREVAKAERERCRKICEEKAHRELDYLRTSSAMTASELAREIGKQNDI